MSGRRRARGWGRSAVLGAAVAAVALLAFPGTAAAAGVTPLVDCMIKNADGSYTVVMGYENTGGSAVNLKPGSPSNRLRPGHVDDVLPSRFEPGLHRGTATGTIDRGSSIEWQLDGQVLRLTASAPPSFCPPSTEMPAEGNGTGIVVALGAAGVVGAVVVRRVRRRTEVGARGAVQDA
jgi:hypothetical protein